MALLLAPEPTLGEEEFFYASTDRASRAARSPPPSSAAQTRAWQTAAALADELEKERGLERITRLPPTVWARGGGIAAGGGGGGGAARRRARIAQAGRGRGRGRGRAGAPGRRRGPRSRRADASDGAAEPRLLAAAAD